MPEVSWTPQVSHRRFAPGSLVFIFESDLALETAQAGLVTLADGMITFRWRDSPHHNKKRLMALPVNEFLRRYLLHLLLPLCLQLLAQSSRFLELNLQQKPLAHHGRFGLVPNEAGPIGPD